MKSLGKTHQSTLAESVTLSGIGVHSGSPVSITLLPADPGSGIVFCRTDFDDRAASEVRAHHALVSATELCTILGDIAGPSVSTVEHLLAALSALSVDNVIVEVDSGEMPILDGSAMPFVDAILQAGIKRQSVARRYIRVRKPVRVELNGSVGEIRPHDCFRVDVEIDFETPMIGRQRIAVDVTADTFAAELARARTFGFMKDVEALWAGGFALGASLDNTIVLGDDRVVNPEGLRFADEFVRHKALDAVGDLCLAGAPLIGAFRSYRGGHRLNLALLDALFADQQAWTLEELAPRRTGNGHGELGERIAVPAYRADAS